MRQVLLRKGKVVVEEVPVPVPEPGEVLIKNHFSLISTGTESTLLKASEGSVPLRVIKNKELISKFVTKVRTEGVKPAFKKAFEKLFDEDGYQVLGYSCAGEVVQVGERVQDILPGMLVAAGGAGYASHSEYIRVPRNLIVKVPEGVPLKYACFTTVGAICIQGLRRANPTSGETFIIYGLGLLGLIALQIARAWGMRVIGIDINSERLKLAKELGADLCLPPEDAESCVMDFTDGFGADAAVIYASTTSSEVVNKSMDLLRHKGRVVVVGDVGMNISRDKMYRKELDLFISTSYGPGRYDYLYEENGVDYPIGYVRWTENRNMGEFLRLLRDGRLNLEPIITGVFNLSSADKAFEEIKKKKQIGVLISYKGQDKKDKVHTIPAVNKKISDGKVGLAFVGPGSFARAFHLPNLLKFSDFFKPLYLVGRDHIKTKDLAKRFNFKNCSTSLDEVLEDPEVTLVFISTPHSLHADQVLKSLRKGKDVFVEKPLCVNTEELEEIKKTIKERDNQKLIVGFNRRYSPLTKKLKKIMETSKTPSQILYRVNAGFLPPDHWVHRIEEGGRIVGEGCHFIDYFLFLTESYPVKICVSAVPPDGTDYVEPDSFSVNFLMENGSVCTLFYTALGSSNLPKEYIEVHTGTMSIVMDNFKSLKVYSNGKTPEKLKSTSLRSQDKGHLQELIEIKKYYEGKENHLITNEECIKSTDITLRVKNLIQGKE